MVYGNDVSKHQRIDVIDKLAKGGKSQFVIMRASFGTYTEDIHFSRYAKDTEKYNIKNSFYHAAYAGNEKEAIQEADFCIDTIEKYGMTNKTVEMPIFYDYEYFSADYNTKRGIVTTPELVKKLTLAFCNRVKERGYKAGVYLNKDYWDRFYGIDFFDKYPELYIWYARPGLSSSDRKCYIWQYASENGADFGYNETIDKNLLYGEFIDVDPMKPLSKDPCRMYIGYASSGDVNNLLSKINGLGIQTEVKDGFITTGYASSGDQCYIMTDCNALGIPYKIYEEPVECEQVKEENKKLKEENKKLKKDVDILKKEKEKLSSKIEDIGEIIMEE